MINDFLTIHHLYQDAIFRYCSRRCSDREIAKDLTQDTFLRFWICMERHDEILHVRAFLYRIAHNLIIDHARRKKEASLDQLLEEGFAPAIDPWHQTYSRLDAERPLRKLRGMKAPFRQALYRRFILGLPPLEIAVLTGETPNTVSVRITRGLRHLRDLLQDTPLTPRVTFAVSSSSTI
jgi:RNA polymerase sigma-70 factor (ECF subfamily)